MKRFLFVAASLLLALTAEAEVRGYGELTLDFKRAKKTGQSIVIPAENGQKQKNYMSRFYAKAEFLTLPMTR